MPENIHRFFGGFRVRAAQRICADGAEAHGINRREALFRSELGLKTGVIDTLDPFLRAVNAQLEEIISGLRGKAAHFRDRKRLRNRFFINADGIGSAHSLSQSGRLE